MPMELKEKIIWSCGAIVLSLVLALILGGVYAITPPSGPVDAAYKINRFTGRVWLIKTYAKPVGQMRVLVAREAEVEKTRELRDEDIQAFALSQPPESPVGHRR